MDDRERAFLNTDTIVQRHSNEASQHTMSRNSEHSALFGERDFLYLSKTTMRIKMVDGDDIRGWPSLKIYKENP